MSAFPGGNPTLEKLRAVEAAILALKEQNRTRPLDYVAWLPGQLAWLSDPGPKPKLLRTGVRGGKTTAGCAEVIWRCEGHHPFNPRIKKAPVRCAVVTSDKQAQGVQIMRLFWELCPKDALVEGIEFSSRTGFKGHVPVVQFKNGSEVVWYSNASGPQALQGSEFDYIHIDEPCAREVFDECRARVRNTGGQVGITLTPLHLPVPWLQEACAEGLVTDHHFRLTVANQTSPITKTVRQKKDGTPWDQAFIDALRAEERGPDAAIKLDGDWEMRTEGQYFKCFDPDRHVSAKEPKGNTKLWLGIDYAAADRDLGMCAVLTGTHSEGSATHVYTFDEVTMPGSATMEHFAAAIVKMLANNRVEWREIDGAFGDNPVKTRHAVNSNIELAKALARELKTRPEVIRQKLWGVKKEGGASYGGHSTKDLRSRWMYNELANDRVRVHPRCKVLIKALQEYDYDNRHPLKDVTDAWMYGLKEFWKTQRSSYAVPAMMLG